MHSILSCICRFLPSVKQAWTDLVPGSVKSKTHHKEMPLLVKPPSYIVYQQAQQPVNYTQTWSHKCTAKRGINTSVKRINNWLIQGAKCMG